MRSIGGLSFLFVTSTILCCSSSDDPPGASPDDAGTNPDVVTTIDAGDGAGIGFATDFINGTRLRAEVYEAAGAQLFAGIHDTKLDISCSFRIAEDGKLRCLPVQIDTIDPNLWGDGTCNGSRLLMRRPGCTIPKMADLGYATTCATGVPVHRIGALTDAAMFWVRPAGTTECNSSPTTGYDVYAIGEKVPASEFVEGAFEEATIADGLGVRSVKGDDGSSQLWTAWDVTRKAPCERGGGTKNERCVPTRVAYEENTFSDIGCGTVAAYGPECLSPPTAILRNGLPDQCGIYEAKYNEVGAHVTATPLYRKTNTTCEDANITGNEATLYWALGADLPLTSLPATTDKDEGPGSIKLRSLASSSGARVIGRTFFDDVRKVECSARRGGDGELRCVPPAITGTQVTYFADIDCKKPLLDAGAGCTPPSYAHLMTPDPSTCKEPTIRYFTVGAKVTPAKIYANFGAGACTEQAMPVGREMYDASTEIAPSTFVAVTKKTL